MTNFTDAVRLLAAPLSTGDTLRTVCPSCDGGRTREKSFVLTKAEEGVLYHCFRAACTFSGGVGGKPGEIVHTTTAKKPWYVPSVKLVLLSDSELAWFEERYGDYARRMGIMFDENSGRYRIPITNVNSTAKGFVLRQWGTTPGVTNPGRGGVPDAPKALTYLYSEQDTKVSYYCASHRMNPTRPCFVVEDQFSAARLGQRVPAAALLGTQIPENAVEELQRAVRRYSNGTVVFALDADAAAQSVELMRKYKTVFADTAAVILTKDVKDMSDTEFDNMLKGWGV